MLEKSNRRNIMRLFLAAATLCGILSLPLRVALAADAESSMEVDARVQHALQFTSAELASKVLNADLAFHWVSGNRFWYRKAISAQASVFVLVDAATGKQTPLFDSAPLSKALLDAGAPGFHGQVSIQTMLLDADTQAAVFSVTRAEATCHWPVYGATCVKPGTLFRCTRIGPTCRSVVQEASASEVVSPSGKSALFVREHNLWSRDLATRAEHALTRDGVESFSYGRLHLQLDTWAAARRRAGEAKPLHGVLWSPDGRHVLALRHDLRATPERLVITEYTPPEGGSPRIHTDRIAVAGDAEYPRAALTVIDATSGDLRRTDLDPHAFEDVALLQFDAGRVWWSQHGDVAWILGTPRGGTEAQLLELQLSTGKTRTLVTERSDRPVLLNPALGKAPNVSILESSHQLLWFSEKDGWGHLYLHDLKTGALIRQVTHGEWLVADLLRVDETSRTAYFTGVGRERGWNPYFRALYKVSLDGGEPTLLTPEVADHDFKNELSASADLPGGSISPSGRYFVDTFSTTAQPERTVIRSVDGRRVAEVCAADISGLAALGWRPPEPFVAKAADGETNLYGVMFRAQDLDPIKKYPVIEVTYPGPWWRNTPTQFRDNFTGSTVLNAHAFAELGAVVVAMDGRGNAYRSAQFHGAFYKSDDPGGSVDHVAAIRQLASTRPYIDLDRVGATGHSSGGDGSLRAMLLHPDFYKVVVSGEGPADYLNFGMDIAIERMLGVPGNKDDVARYQRIATPHLLSHLTRENKLLLLYAGADEEVPLQQGFELFAALQNAGILYETLIVPDAGHWGGRAPYGVMRTLRFFAENLGPPRGR